MKEDLLFDKIERYLLNQLPGEERATFEAEIAADPALARQVAAQRKEHEMMEALLEKRLRGKMAQWNTETNAAEPEAEEQGKRPVKRRWLWWLTACAAMIVALVLWIPRREGGAPVDPVPAPVFQPPGTELPVATDKQEKPEPLQSPQKPPAKPAVTARYIALARQHRGDINFNVDLVRNTGPTSSAIKDALTPLSARRFSEGIDLLSSLPDTSSVYWDAQFYIGLAYLAQNQSQISIAYLAEVAKQTNNLLSDDAAWYLALAYLEQGNRKKCEAALQRITADNQHPYYEKANKLKDALKTID